MTPRRVLPPGQQRILMTGLASGLYRNIPCGMQSIRAAVYVSPTGTVLVRGWHERSWFFNTFYYDLSKSDWCWEFDICDHGLNDLSCLFNRQTIKRPDSWEWEEELLQDAATILRRRIYYAKKREEVGPNSGLGDLPRYLRPDTPPWGHTA